MDPINVVWENTLDGGRFHVIVTQPNAVVVETALDGKVRFDDRDTIGTLKVTVVETGEVILDEKVPISHGAIFGPDTYDLAAWQGATLAAVDAWIAAHP